MELYQLKELAALGQYGTISKAAEAVGVSQPAMSRAMKLLEDELGVPIFQRSSNSIVLNDTGWIAVRLAAGITESVDRAVEEIRAADRRQNTVLVGAEAPAPLWSVVSMLSALDKERTIAGEMKSMRVLSEGLQGGTYRYAITAEPLSIDGFSTVRLGEENLMFLLPSDHRLADRKSLSFSDLDGENMLLYEDIGFWRGLPERMMPGSRFLIQSDSEAFRDLVMKSTIPSFTTDLFLPPPEGKTAIDISDAEAHAVFYVSSRTKDAATLSYLAKHFRYGFRSRQMYAV